MNHELTQLKSILFDNHSLEMSDYRNELESMAYAACQFRLNGDLIICRTAKQTPKKIGQFVTSWKRNAAGITEPFHENESIDFLIIITKTEKHFGHFVFPKSILIQKGIMSTDRKEGKRGFRVYPSWDIATNKQAIKTQKWQLNYFSEIKDTTDLKKAAELYVH